jgi:hypothetical protein
MAPARASLHRRHCLDRILDQVGQHLLQLPRIALGTAVRRAQVELERHAVPVELRARAHQGRLDQGMQVDAAGLRPRLPQRLQGLDDLPGALALRHDRLQQAAHLVHPRRVAPQPAQAGAGVGGNRHQRLVDFVRDRRRQLADRGHRGATGQLGLGLAQGFLEAHHQSRGTPAAIGAAGRLRMRMGGGRQIAARGQGGGALVGDAGDVLDTLGRRVCRGALVIRQRGQRVAIQLTQRALRQRQLVGDGGMAAGRGGVELADVVQDALAARGLLRFPGAGVLAGLAAQDEHADQMGFR